jgi:hypothetical protein
LGLFRVSASFGASDICNEEVRVGVGVELERGEKADASASEAMRSRE